MKLDKKKELAARTLKIGKERIAFASSRLEEIKEAITKQDIRELKKEGAILIKEKKGRKKIIRKKKKKGPGKIKIRVKKRKQEYVKITRKLREYIKNMKKQGMISKDIEKDIRNKIRNRKFSSLSSLREYIKNTGGLSDKKATNKK